MWITIIKELEFGKNEVCIPLYIGFMNSLCHNIFDFLFYKSYTFSMTGRPTAFLSIPLNTIDKTNPMRYNMFNHTKKFKHL